VSVSERNLLGRGYYGKTSVQYGQYTRGGSISFVDPYFLNYRLALGLDLFYKEQQPTSYTSYGTKTMGVGGRIGIALQEDLSLQLRYSLYRQEISLQSYYQNCNNINPNSANGTYPTGDKEASTIDPATGAAFTTNCWADGEASLATKRELANGATLTSLLGYTLAYNTLDNNKNPTQGILAEFRQDFAGVGGDVKYIRETFDLYAYHEVVSDLVGFLHLQGGIMNGWGGDGVRMLDDFKMGPNLVRGFASSGIGPRDMTQYPWTAVYGDALGGTKYWGASIEFQMPLYFMPKDAGIKVAAYADAGSVWDYQGPTSDPTTGEVLSGNICSSWQPSVANPSPCAVDNAMHIRTSVGVGLIWNSPFGPLRFDYAFPLTKEPYDRVQQFRFGGGTKF
jgi:outer membrane protein insertion porin family